uniref:Uncharacterized protein n=1 Tax=Arundo donax TaxID=35708 RepID=A0A0A9CIH9_ARUDO
MVIQTIRLGRLRTPHKVEV